MLRSLQLSLRNLARYKTRTIITIIAVLVSVLVSTVVDSLIRGIFDMSTYNLLSYESSEVTIYSPGYFEKRKELPTDILIDYSLYKATSEKLDNMGFSYTPRYKSVCEIISYNDKEDSEFSLNAILVGVDSKKDKAVFKLSESISDGSWLK
ncbi:MAG: hypothetical protein PUC01_09720, partial [Spirochaetales bacterium]|nr:hypothetical protein [Spirochaetales bacterium]